MRLGARTAIVTVTAVTAMAVASTASAGTFPGRNGPIAFDALNQTDGTVQIYRMSPTGKGLKELTSTTGRVWNEDPDFSANGRRIYFDSLDRATTNPAQIYRMTSNGKSRQLADAKKGPADVWPSINRAGSTVAVLSYPKGGASAITTMRTDGRNRKVIARANGNQGVGSAAFAPSGGRLAYVRVTYGKNGQGVAKSALLVRNGKRTTNVTARLRGKFFGPAWSPNGRRILALRGQATLVSMTPKGTGLRVLTNVKGQETSIASAVYSPNGKQIAYLQCVGDCGDPQLKGQGSIWVMNANGSGKHRVFNGGNGTQPSARLTWGVR
jgi:Tol biopolymer transport system component